MMIHSGQIERNLTVRGFVEHNERSPKSSNHMLLLEISLVKYA